MKYLVALAFVGILGSLAWALFHMLRGNSQKGAGKGGGMARALTVRIGLSVLLFLCILIAWKLGYIQPGGLPVGK
ncbi:twin transmembrane helix small protein [Xenophilus sp. Marseille-Q4582]|uniref:twin transmembrane helix small protein n=1 Tax=Xenophilus sp. Marseille-Q4582 TaxID=2866600 RepID=UPI001CE4069D|nr:twin transmembrane helix small protein [Xenophilus sp. Marseille-Q4582]